jgi:hypothetical protein
VFRPADRIFHATLLTDVNQFFQATGGSLLTALGAALEFLQFAISLLNLAWREFRWRSTAGADWLGLERSKADRAGADCWCWSVVALAACLAVEGPCTDIVRPAVAVDVADVIKNDRMGFAGCWSKDATNLLQVKANAGCWSQEDCCCDGWDVGAF